MILTIYANEKKDLAIFWFVTNPDFISNEDYQSSFDAELPMVVTKTPIELNAPYSTADLAQAIQSAFERWDSGDPYKLKNKRSSLVEEYYKIKGFKAASFGKKMLSVAWYPDPSAVEDKNNVALLLPTKAGKYFLGVGDVVLADEASWSHYADAINHLLELDVTQLRPYRTFKSKLNV